MGRWLTALAGVLSLALACAPSALAAPGDLDSSFGDGGRVTLTPAGREAVYSDVAIQPDGKIVLAGYTNSSTGDTDIAVTRLNSNGTPDQGFGSGGTLAINTDFAGRRNDLGNAVTLQPDGKIVVAGETDIPTGQRLPLVRALDTASRQAGTKGRGYLIACGATSRGAVRKIVASGYRRMQWASTAGLSWRRLTPRLARHECGVVRPVCCTWPAAKPRAVVVLRPDSLAECGGRTGDVAPRRPARAPLQPRRASVLRYGQPPNGRRSTSRPGRRLGHGGTRTITTRLTANGDLERARLQAHVTHFGGTTTRPSSRCRRTGRRARGTTGGEHLLFNAGPDGRRPGATTATSRIPTGYAMAASGGRSTSGATRRPVRCGCRATRPPQAAARAARRW